MLVGFEKFLTKESFKYLLFGFVNGQRQANAIPCFFCGKHRISVDDSILNFMKYHQLNDDNFSVAAARADYYRLQKEYVELQKST